MQGPGKYPAGQKQGKAGAPTVLGLDHSRLHLVQVLLDAHLLISNDFLLLVQLLLDLLAHDLQGKVLSFAGQRIHSVTWDPSDQTTLSLVEGERGRREIERREKEEKRIKKEQEQACRHLFLLGLLLVLDHLLELVIGCRILHLQLLAFDPQVSA